MKVAAVVAGVLLATLLGLGAWLYAPDKPRAELEAKYAAAPNSFLPILGLRLHVRDTGPKDAPAVILLHGFGASLHTWDAWAEALAAEHRVIRIDLPGFGLTGPDPTGDYTDTRSVNVLVALMDALGVQRASLVGNSMGGRIAWKLAALRPERVERLVLVSPDGFAGPGRAYGVAPKIPLMARLLPFVMPERLLRATLVPAYGDPATLTDEAVARYRDMLLAPGVRRAILARMGQDRLADPVPLLRRIQAPALLIWGEEDRMVPATNAADYLAAMPGTGLVTFPDLGHVPQEEAPARSLVPVRAFLSK